LGYTASNLVKKVRRGNRTDEGGKYVSRKSVESLKKVRDKWSAEKGNMKKNARIYPREEKDVFGFPFEVRIIC
jgi:hypothetical protein